MPDVELAHIISALAVFISAISLWKTLEFRNKVGEVLELRKKVEALVLEREKRQAEKAKSADIGARLIKLAPQKRRLRVFNKGDAPAHSVRVQFPKENHFVNPSDLGKKFPMEKMEKRQPVDVLASVTMGSPRKQLIELSWKNPNGEECNKQVEVTV